ncbi:hypothetical protein FB565_003588 [Actinoplanes lutulentus]|uniref:Uncharacterized protein n=1 Tax=Actinoplanes lutulentus TaxID=1287878 RepID=A0A327Z4H0_9ACTN|nr:DUF6292 family protein [Actinoplanes lutulentus]MBB2943859.1 hypothetical protein [Actinoplanes lutulentus]RAK29400.1 hypothetical protein B0I29_118192 [Actinoplanes lutulentus]
MTGGHYGYIQAVAEALEEAGIPVADFRADDRVPRDGWIAFDLVRQVALHGRLVWDCEQAGVAWAEDQGWVLVTVGFARTQEGLDVASEAAPREVVRAVARKAGIGDF